MRRVVTGQDADGRSVFVSDEEVEPITVALVPGGEFHRVWGGDATPVLPTNGAPPDPHLYFPPAGGYRFGFFTLGPESVTLPEDLDYTAALAEFRAKLPGMGEWMEIDEPGMHTTDTVDLDLVLEGECWLELDHGEEVRLGPGDCVVQNGTRHRWHNRTERPCRLFVTLIGARRAH
jgi:mannose-6-phosphate isomerase-like protein (cupin superfamily)